MGNKGSGASSSSSSTPKPAKKEKKLAKKEKKIAKKKVKDIKAQFTAFILGIGGSGKTTFVKQMKLIYDVGFTDDEKSTFKDILIHNSLSSLMEITTHAIRNDKNLLDSNLRIKRRLTEIINGDQEDFDPELADDLMQLWNDPAIQSSFKELASPESKKDVPVELAFLDYHMKNLKNYLSENYVPSNDDILRARQRTTGSNSNEMVMNKKYHWSFVDMGGQIQERGKWDEIIAQQSARQIVEKKRDHYCLALFFISIDEFNTPYSEYDGLTKFQAAMDVFTRTLKNRVGESLTAIVLFMNKIDLFQKKIESPAAFKAFQETFPKYDGEVGDIVGACEFLAGEFRKVYRKETEKFDVSTELDIHTTCALDTEGMRHVFNSVRTNLLANSLNTGGSGFSL